MRVGESYCDCYAERAHLTGMKPRPERDGDRELHVFEHGYSPYDYMAPPTISLCRTGDLK